MTDKAHAYTDREIERMERHLSVIYRSVGKKLDKLFAEYAETIKKQSDKLLQAVNDAETPKDKQAAKMAYVRFYSVTVKRDKRFKETQQAAIDALYSANQESARYINSKMAKIYAENYNQEGHGIEADTEKEYSFKPVTVEDADLYGQITRQGVDKQKDNRWNAKNIASGLIAGAVALQATDKVFSGTSRRTTHRNLDTARRQASDTATDAESKGRFDSMYRARDEGFHVQKIWIATLDNRTRESHIEYDGMPPLELDDEYNTGLKKPRDPDCGIMAEICNCRCRIQHTMGKAQGGTRAAREGDVTGSYKKSSSFRDTKTVNVPNMSYKEWMQWRSRSN